MVFAAWHSKLFFFKKKKRRYLPKLIFALKEIKTKKFVLDGEIVIPVQGSFSFDLCCR